MDISERAETGEAELPTMAIGPVRVARATREEAISFLVEALRADHRHLVAFANAHGLLMAMDDPAYAETLRNFLVLNDGIGAEIGARALYGQGFPDNLNGTDLIPAFLAAAPPDTRVFLLGAKQDIVECAAAIFAERYPHLVICGARDGYFSREDEEEIARDIADANTDILLVAMGNPLQEELIGRIFEQSAATLAFGVGALFDFTAGAAVRAPEALRASGMEWVYRLAREPRRLGRRYTTGVLRYLWKIACLTVRTRLFRARSV
jgi:alpha-1,3-mannosyltransferase